MTGVLDASPEHDDFAALFAAERRAVYQLAVLLCGDRTAAEDATAEAFARVLRKWQRGRPDNPKAYLRQSLVNHVRGRFRRLATERRHAARRTADGRGGRAFEDLSADHHELCAALMTLPPRQRAAVVLRYFEDLPEAEVASLLGTSIGPVKGYVSRGLDRLRLLIEEGIQSD